MVIKQMSFTEENLRKHLRFDEDLFVTGRCERKGRKGDIFQFNQGETGFWVLTAISKRPVKVLEYAMKYFRIEGFSTWQELYDELSTIYGENSEIFAHYFQKTSLDEGDFA